MPSQYVDLPAPGGPMTSCAKGMLLRCDRCDGERNNQSIIVCNDDQVPRKTFEAHEKLPLGTFELLHVHLPHDIITQQ